MNPFSRFLSRGVKDAPLTMFVAHWDRLEALVVGVYKGGVATPEDEAEWREVRRWLRGHYAAWEEALAPLWPETLVGGMPASTDPFLSLINLPAAADFVANWQAMQTLPAAREALNRLLLQRAGKHDEERG